MSISSLLHASIYHKSLSLGKSVHAHIIQTGLQRRDTFVANNLINMYLKCGRIDDARQVFDKMPERNVVSWSLIIGSYPKHGLPEEALKLFNQMQRSGIQPSPFSFSCVLAACVGLASMEDGRMIHGSIIRNGCETNVFVGSVLVDLYVKGGSIDDARQVFDKMPDRNVVSWTSMVQGYVQRGDVDEALRLFRMMPQPDVVSWTAMITAFSRCGRHDEALTLFSQMKASGVLPNQFTFASVLPACANLRALEVGREIHDDIIRRGFRYDIFMGSALVDMYIKCGNLRDARQVFDKMAQRNIVNWNSMIVAYAQNGLMHDARMLFQEIPQKDVVSRTAMISGYAQNGNVDEALKLFEEMPDRDVVSWTSMIAAFVQNGHVEKAMELFKKVPKQDVVSWTAMISGYAQNGHPHEALKLFEQMQRTGLKPDSDSLGSFLLSCANLAALQHGREVHDHIVRNGFYADVFLSNALVDMYAKCGSIVNARKVFDRMPTRDVISWNAMIVGYAMNGYGNEAIQLFEQMRNISNGILPNHVTFIGVLSACCHAGLVDDGWRYFNCMAEYYEITPSAEHYSCMVDLLGRAGRLDDAHEFINKMPIKPDAVVLGSLLGACRTHMNIELGEHLAGLLFEMDPENAAPYVALSNTYAEAGKWDDMVRVRKLMKDRKVKKKPGCSWIEVNGKMLTFLAVGKSKSHLEKIDVELDRLSGQARET